MTSTSSGPIDAHGRVSRRATNASTNKAARPPITARSRTRSSSTARTPPAKPLRRAAARVPRCGFSGTYPHRTAGQVVDKLVDNRLVQQGARTIPFGHVVGDAAADRTVDRSLVQLLWAASSEGRGASVLSASCGLSASACSHSLFGPTAHVARRESSDQRARGVSSQPPTTSTDRRP